MIYNPPMGGAANDPYVTGNPATATAGSIPPGAAIEQPQREIVNVITAAGLTASSSNVGQLAQAIQNGGLWVANAGGSSDAITASFSPAVTGLQNGMSLSVRSSAANLTATPTFTPNNGVIAAHTIVKGAGAPLVPGDIAGGGHWIELQWDVVLGAWVLLNPAFGASGSVGSMNGAIGLSAATTLTAANFGSFFEFGGSAAFTTTIPSANNNGGMMFRFANNGGAMQTIEIGQSPGAVGWNSTAAYVAGLTPSLVYYNGINYSCILANTNQAPPNSTYWKAWGFFFNGVSNGGMIQLAPQQSLTLISDGYNWCAFEGSWVVAQALAGYVSSSALTTILASYETIAALATTLAGYTQLSQAIGLSQSYNVVTGSRAANTIYTNTGTKPMTVMISLTFGYNVAGTATAQAGPSGSLVNLLYSAYSTLSSLFPSFSFIVQPGQKYQLVTTGTLTINNWSEMS